MDFEKAGLLEGLQADARRARLRLLEQLASDGFSPEELSFVRGWLGGKATTIFGGSAEIQSNIISKRILGLPDPLGASSN